MKPPPFTYEDPSTLDEVLVLLARHGDGAVPLAGGQSLVPQLNLRRRRPSVVVDLRRVPGLAGVDVHVEERRTVVHLGAGTTLRALLGDPVTALVPGLEEAVRRIAHPEVRNRSTVGGNVAQAEPAGELVTTLVGLDAVAHLRSSAGERTLRVAQLVTGPFRTGRRPDELIVGVSLVVPEGRAAWREVTRRADDFPVVGAHVRVVLDDEGLVAEAAVAVGGAGPVPLRVTAAEQVLAGRRPSAALRGDVVEAVRDSVDPLDDAVAPGAYRRAVAATLVGRALDAVWSTEAPTGEAAA